MTIVSVLRAKNLLIVNRDLKITATGAALWPPLISIYRSESNGDEFLSDCCGTFTSFHNQ